MSCKSDHELSHDWTIAGNMSKVMVSFLGLGLASCLCNPAGNASANGEPDTSGKPPSWWTYEMTFIATSTADLDLVDSDTCCEYRADSSSCTGSTITSLLFSAHSFHFPKV